MNIPVCWHRPGLLKHFKHVTLRTCRTCFVPVEECPCVSWGRSPDGGCPFCEGSGWIATIRSKVQILVDYLEI
jgi:hypothetical protein